MNETRTGDTGHNGRNGHHQPSSGDADYERLMPQHVEAEAAVLGSILISPGTLATVMTRLVPADFYREVHRLIYEGMVRLAARREPVDLLTLQDDLERHDTLETVGGMSYVSSLAMAVPTSFYAGHYADIVWRKARARQLIKVGAEIAALGYAQQDDTEAAQGQALDLVLALGARDPVSGPVAWADLQASLAADIIARREEQVAGRPVGLPTGIPDLDKAIVGLERGQLVYLAARTSHGKSAFALGLAEHLARTLTQQAGSSEQAGGVEYVTLEMDDLEQARRLIAARSQVDAQYLQSGWDGVDERERQLGWQRVLDALEETRAAFGHNLWLYDRILTMASLRAYVQAGVAQRRLRVLVVDQLDLLADEAGGKTPEEFARITRFSRALKQMARAYNITVVCLVQLSRNAEYRRNKRPILPDLRQCVVGNTRLVDAATGRQTAIRDIQPGMTVLGMNAQQQIVAGTVADVWATGVKPVFTVTTRSGHQVTATANHPFQTTSGWKVLERLQVGEPVATAFRLPPHGQERPQQANLCRLLGYLIGDGTYQRHRGVGFISADPGTLEDVREIVVAEFPGVTVQNYRVSNTTRAQRVAFSAVDENGYGKPYGNPLREWLRALGIFGQRDSDKRVPQDVFEAGVGGAASFLAGYVASDGCIKRGVGRHGVVTWSIQFDTVSHGLAEDVVVLLARLGIAAKINKGYQSQKATQPLYRVQVARAAHNLYRFVYLVPVRGRKSRLLEQLGSETIDHAEEWGGRNGGLLALPPHISEMMAAKSRAADLPWTETWRHQGKSVSRDECMALAERINDDELRMWAVSDVLWDEIVSIEPAGEEETFDVRIPECGSFLANGVVVHNSGQLEQDADVVLGLYRPAMYDEARAEQETRFAQYAEVQVLKARGGQVNRTTALCYDAHLTRFSPWPDEWRVPDGVLDDPSSSGQESEAQA